MSRRALSIVILLVIVALACANIDGQVEQSQFTPAVDNQVSTPAQTSEPTENTLFLPDISAETTPGSQNQPDNLLEPAPSEPGSTDTLPEPTSNTFYLPGISSAGTPQALVETTQDPVGGDAYVEILFDRTAIEVGETVTVTGRPVNIGMPYYYLMVADEGVEDALPLVEVSYENQAADQDGSSQVLELVSAEGGLDQVIFVLRGKAPGSAAVSINATGEVQEDGALSWGGGGSEVTVITVEE